jgi:hypothetical protein
VAVDPFRSERSRDERRRKKTQKKKRTRAGWCTTTFVAERPYYDGWMVSVSLHQVPHVVIVPLAQLKVSILIHHHDTDTIVDI